MMIVALIGVLVLGWSLGKNNLSNLFGTAIGTHMVHLRTAEILAALFVAIGAFLSGSATTSSVLKLSHLGLPQDIIVILISAILVMDILSRLGIPASIVQTIVGAVVGVNLYQDTDTDWHLVQSIIGAWIWAPIIAAGIGFILMKGVRRILIAYPLSLIKRDLILRILLIFGGVLAAFALGANNIGTLTGPFLAVFDAFPRFGITALVCGAIGLGCLMADQKVIETVGRKLFPLSPTEGFVVMLATALGMIFFSMEGIRNILIFCHLPTFPLVPIPMSNVMIGAIVGISVAKGGYGLHYAVLGRILISWFMVPVVAGGLSFLLMMIGN